MSGWLYVMALHYVVPSPWRHHWTFEKKKKGIHFVDWLTLSRFNWPVFLLWSCVPCMCFPFYYVFCNSLPITNVHGLKCVLEKKNPTWTADALPVSDSHHAFSLIHQWLGCSTGDFSAQAHQRICLHPYTTWLPFRLMALCVDIVGNPHAHCEGYFAKPNNIAVWKGTVCPVIEMEAELRGVGCR